ncbi:L-aspartate oxidase [Longirhabdus pacifica]|uniref:L-aspartate oxidase n=1 Tax=Longirhabdus pacifica TaxID=2305227 RepID=UPI0010093ADA|nr:L-aspartate oxidase [Longirhabdus pacifica]
MIPRYITNFSTTNLPVLNTDVLVIGGGIAGLFTAIKISEHSKVLLITKKTIMDSNTQYAQGGIAAVFSDDDSPSLHRQDTLIAGAGLCENEAVTILTNEGPDAVKELIALGTEFDVEDGAFALTKEGAHSKRRILHANGDATGSEIVRALYKQAKNNENITIYDEHFVIDLLTENGICAGALIENHEGKREAVRSKAVVLCAGGAGQLYRYTTNPEIATGDGIAMAYRAGTNIQDIEFIQFHPTALCYPGAPRFLITEAVRGEGAVLRNNKGERFMSTYHPQMELAPRDVVARAIIDEMTSNKSTYVYLDITHESESFIKKRFPTIYRYCLQFGLDITTDWIPVAPAAHYMMGGVKTDLHGESSIKNLFACGEVSSTGVHGANRLASNSLSEAIVFGSRIADKISEIKQRESSDIAHEEQWTEHIHYPIIEKRLKLQKLMLRYVGLKRSRKGLEKGLAELKKQLPMFQINLQKREEYEFANLLTCALLVGQAAIKREESRGGHYREDFPETDDLLWKQHIILQREQGKQQTENGGDVFV